MPEVAQASRDAESLACDVPLAFVATNSPFFAEQTRKKKGGKKGKGWARRHLLQINSQTVREASALANELSEESDQFGFLRAACLPNLKASVRWVDLSSVF
jgi:hypothetical protein